MSIALATSGLPALVEIAMAQVDSTSPELTSDIRDQIRDALTRFVQGHLPFVNCQAVLLATMYRDSPLTRLQEILSVPEAPLPFYGDSPSTDESLLMRRRTRPWTNAEDDRLLAAIGRYGFDNWQQVARFVGNGRNRAQCSQRWARGLNPRISKRAWSQEEEQQLQALVKQYGTKSWAKIASVFGDRSDVQCRYHYRQTVAADGREPEMELPLMRKSRLTASTNLLEGMPPPAAVEEDQQITLMQARACVSTPMIGAGERSFGYQWRLSMSPAHERALPQLATARVKPVVFGSDPDALDSFLKHFQ
jgi:hypothetical protein